MTLLSDNSAGKEIYGGKHYITIELMLLFPAPTRDQLISIMLTKATEGPKKLSSQYKCYLIKSFCTKGFYFCRLNLWKLYIIFSLTVVF